MAIFSWARNTNDETVLELPQNKDLGYNTSSSLQVNKMGAYPTKGGTLFHIGINLGDAPSQPSVPEYKTKAAARTDHRLQPVCGCGARRIHTEQNTQRKFTFQFSSEEFIIPVVGATGLSGTRSFERFKTGAGGDTWLEG